jgi:hypothetical protein
VSDTRKSLDFFGVPRVLTISRDPRAAIGRGKPAPARKSKKFSARLRAMRARNENIFSTM